MVWYTRWFGTPYYKLLYGHRDEADAKAWVEAIQARWKLPTGARLLDLACGRGRHARHFAALGLRVTGADISPESIAEARALVPGAEFLVHDMRVPIAGARFDAIVCLFTSLGYSGSMDDDQRVLSAVEAMLVPGGRFVLDFMNTPLVLRQLVPEESVEAAGVRFRVRRRCEGGAIVKRIRVYDSGGTCDFEERVQALTPAQIEAMALRAGLLIEDRTDGPEPTPFDPERSNRFVLWARKSEA
ncbi:MAG: class I SAM-dependent methyltransferase [Flavobacteriales bacterium]